MKNKKILKILAALTLSAAAAGCMAFVGCNKNTHTHTYDEDNWIGDETGHWHAANCGHDVKKDFVDHHTDEDGNNYCDDCNYKIMDDAKLTEITVSGKTAFYQGQTFDKNELVVTAKFEGGVEKNVTADATVSTPDMSKLKEQTVTVSYGGKTATHDIMVYLAPAPELENQKHVGWTPISSVEELNAFRALESSSDNFYLSKDIDLTGVVLEGTKVVFTGKFDGNGHTISNATYVENAANKSGILVKELRGGGEVTNVKFQNCISSLSGETIGIVAGMSYGEVTISKVEFNGCTVKCNNYAGLCIGRTNSNDSKVTLSEITAKNGTSTTVTSYGGTLIGDIAAGKSATERAELNIINCDLDIELKGANGNGGFLSGRIRQNTNFNIKNVLLRNAICPEATGLICGGGSNNAGNSTVTVENLYIISTNAAILQSCAVKDATNPVKTFSITYTNSYIGCTPPADNEYIVVKEEGGEAETQAETEGETGSEGEEEVETATYLTQVNPADADEFWLKDTLKLDFTKEWTTEKNNPALYRLTAASTNAQGPEAVATSLKLATANTQLRFEKGTDFSTAGLAVTVIYSDDVNLVLTSDKYIVDSSAFKKDAAGKYTIVVKLKEDESIVAQYEVEVVAQTDFEVDTQFAKIAYVEGEDIDLSKLLVYASWTDGQSLLTTNFTTNADTLDLTTAGAKDLVISMTGFDDKHVTISVVGTKPYVVDGKAYINVDKNAEVTYSGEKVDGVETFKTINEAVDYLVAANLGDEIVKVMYVADGVYTEKITIPAKLKNLKMIGQSRENTKLEYDAVEDSVNPLNGNKYTMDCATLNVNAEGFGLANITVNNTFDYINDSTNYANPQGFALTINEDGAVIDNVTLYGNQDTLFFRKGRVYLNNSKISGNVDFIFGENNGLAFFEKCTIEAITRSNTKLENNGYVTAMKGDVDNHPTYGYIFNECDFTDDGNLLSGSMSLGRPWGGGASVAMISCTFSEAYSTAAYDGSTKSRWFDMSGNLPQNAHFCEYDSKGAGAVTDASWTAEAKKGGIVLTETEAANYTAANLFAKTNGGVTWSAAFDYEGELTKLKSYASKVDGTEIIVKNGDDVIGDEIEVANGDVVNLDIFMKEWNASKKNITLDFENETVAIWNNGIKGLKLGETKLTLTCGTVTRDITVKIIEATPFEVTFVTNGGSEVEAQEVFKNNKITAVTTTKDEAIFRGWFTDAKFTTPFDPATDKIVEATTLYAKFVDYVDLAKENVTYSFNTTEGDGVYSFQYDGNNQGKTEDDPATFYGLNIWGTKLTERWKSSGGSNDDTQFSAGTCISFAVEKFATVVVTYRSNTSATLGIGEDVVELESNTSVTYYTNVAGIVKLQQGASNGYITGIKVTYPEKVLDKSTRVDFGSNGNYLDFKGLDQSNATYGEIQAACNQIMIGSILEFYVNPNATIHISGNWSVGYKINGTEVKTSNAGGEDNTGLEKDFFFENGGKITIESIHNNNYFYYISVSYPHMITENTRVDFGHNGNSNSSIDGVSISCNNRLHDDTSSQLNNGTITINVAAGANIHISGNWCVDYTIGETVVQGANAGGDDANLEYDYVVQKDGEVEIVMGNTSSNYFYYIEITFD